MSDIKKPDDRLSSKPLVKPSEDAGPSIIALNDLTCGCYLSRRQFLQLSTLPIIGNFIGCTNGGSNDGKSADAIAKEQCIFCSEKAGAHLQVRRIKYSPNGQQFVSVGFDKKLKVWSSPQGELQIVNTSFNNQIVTATFSPDSTLLAVAVSPNVDIFSMPDGNRILSIDHASALAHDVHFTPDGKYLISACDDNTIKVWDMPTGTFSNEFATGHVNWTEVMAISPDGTKIVTGAAGSSNHAESIKLWEFPLGTPIATINNLDDWVGDLWFSKDSRYLVARGSGTSDVYVFLSDTGALHYKFPERYVAIALDSNEDLLAVTIGGEIQILDIESGSLLDSLSCSGNRDGGRPAGVAASPDGNFVTIASYHYGSIRVFNLHTKSLETCLFDEAATLGSEGLNVGVTVTYYEVITKDYGVIRYTVPEGSLLPGGAICTCNSVEGTYIPPGSGGGGGGGGGIRICTCNSIWI